MEKIESIPDLISKNQFHNLSIKSNEPLKDKNWFRTGGNAKHFCEPENEVEFAIALEFARKNDLKIFILGEGANILISDKGFDGIVIRPKLKSIKIISQSKNEVFVEAGCGLGFEDLINFCLENNLVGLEEFSGIPGVVGGAIFMNIHYFEFLLGSFLVNAKIIERESGRITEVNPDWFKFGYNSSTLHHKNHYLISATFKLKKVSELEAAFAKGRSIEIIRHRNKRYPISNTCGSFFRNFTSEEVENEKTGKKLIFVAYYLDKLGFKGTLSFGDAAVSHLHANMLVNKGNASSADIINLAKTMQKALRESFNINPQSECQFIGFEENPLN